jgi:hypothetical protein
MGVNIQDARGKCINVRHLVLWSMKVQEIINNIAKPRKFNNKKWKHLKQSYKIKLDFLYGR